MAKRRERPDDDNEPVYLRGGEGEQCRVCHQEYTGSCPIGSAQCPFEKEEGDEEDADPDFDDVKDLEEVLDDDEEADKLTEEEVEISPEDEEKE
jgi:hypothetical protein